jgi:DNA-binding beta-propeller fold protein YncE
MGLFPMVVGLCLVSTVLWATGCQDDLKGLRGVERAGIDPPKDRFFFPTGVGITPDGRYLFVTNGNADLKYNGGTMTMVDLSAMGRRLAAGADLGCRWGAQDREVLECDEGGLIIDQASVRIGNFASQVVVLDRPAWASSVSDGAVGQYRLFVPVRGDPSLTYIDVLFEGETADAAVRCLSCGKGCVPGDGKIPDCSGDHVVSGPPADAPFVEAQLPQEPYSVYLDEALRLLYVAHLTSGALALFDLSDADIPVLRQVTPDLLSVGSSGTRGGFGIAALQPGDPEGEIVVANRVAPELVSLRLQSAAVQAAQCESGFCHGRVCSQCAVDADCPGDQSCEWKTEGELFVCTGGAAALGEGCGEGADCASGFCVAGWCAQCAQDEDCAGENTCARHEVLGYRVCRGGDKLRGNACSSGEECLSGFCNNGRCSECNTDEDCSGLQRCMQAAKDETSWYYACVGGMGADGASCIDLPRSPADLEPLLVYANRTYLSAPYGPVEALIAGDVRGVAVHPDGHRVYALSRVPPGLLIMEDVEVGSAVERKVIDFVDLCVQPSNIGLHRDANGWLLVYVVCWASGQVYVVDPEAATLVSIISVGSGPHDIVFAPDAPWVPADLRERAYVTNFAENTISIIDLNPESTTWHRVIGRIGFTEKAVSQ